jgi:hypothetical protein
MFKNHKKTKAISGVKTTKKIIEFFGILTGANTDLNNKSAFALRRSLAQG